MIDGLVNSKGLTLLRKITKMCLSFSEVSLWEQLAESRAQVEHWQGVATICELSKQEELAELQKQCDQEIQSLQEALRGQTGFFSFS